MLKITPKTALKLLKTPVRELAKQKGFGHKSLLLLAEEFRKLALARIGANKEW